MSGYSYAEDSGDSYCYPGTSVLRNKMEILDKEALLTAEREITSLKLLMLREKPVKGHNDFAHLRAIHRFIFCDIYDWAGERRTGEFLAKGKTIFCLGRYIDQFANAIFSELAAKNNLCCMEREEFIKELAYFMGEVNALHPFREGNGRTAREFFRQLSKNAGYNLDFGDVDKEKLLAADIAAFHREYTPLVVILDHSVTKIQKK